MSRLQRGATTVEFAIIGIVVMVVMLGIIEFGRALFVINALTESTRRGARMAAVCPVNDPKPASVAVYDDGSGNSSFVSGLTPANVLIEYLDTAGGAIADPAGNFLDIRFVRARIVGFTHTLLIPTMLTTIPMSGFSTTLPRESLGIPRAGVVTPC
jgi:Flp pilus assembly pilin Flp